MLSKLETLAVILYLASGTIRGLTRLHKVAFLVQQEVGIGRFNFKPSKHGSWSPDLEDLVRYLEEKELLTIKEPEEHTIYNLQERPAKILIAENELLERGRRAYSKLLNRDLIMALALREKVKIYSRMPLTYLLAYVYARYPDYTRLSIIKEKIKALELLRTSSGLTSKL